MTPATPENEKNLPALPASYVAHDTEDRSHPCRVRTTVPRWTRRNLLLGLCALLVGLHGCGGISALSGGSIPIGLTRVYGKVVRADNPLIPLSNASVSLVSPSVSADKGNFKVNTDANGKFDFPNIPLGAASDIVKVSVEPNNSSLRATQLTFATADKSASNLIVAVPPANFDVSQVAGVVISPTNIKVRTDVTTQLTVRVVNSAGQPLPVVPSLLFNGTTGTLGTDGTFFSTGIGTGSIIAIWSNTIHSDTATIQVDNTLPDNPAPPPPPQIPIDTKQAGGYSLTQKSKNSG